MSNSKNFERTTRVLSMVQRIKYDLAQIGKHLEWLAAYVEDIKKDVSK